MRMLFWAILVVDFSAILDGNERKAIKEKMSYLLVEGDLTRNFFGLF